MLDLKLYHLMNWSMLIDGLFFWWLMLNPRTMGASIVLNYSKRIVILFLVMLPQIILGGYIALSRRELYDVYDVCGRAWPIASSTDQQLGGLLTWIPASMMSVLGILVVIKYILRHGRRHSEGGASDLKFTALETGQ
jgi:putative membrane protein